MTEATGLLIIAFTLSLVVGAIIVLLVMLVMRAQERRPPETQRVRHVREGTSFLFSDGALVDATPAARQLLMDLPGDAMIDDWAGLAACLAPRYPSLPEEATMLEGSGRLRVPGRHGDAGLDIEWWDRMIRLSVLRGPDELTEIHPVTLDAMQEDVALLALIAEETPLLIWRTAGSGQISWANRAYLDLSDQIEPDAAASWPPPVIFPDRPEVGASKRICLALPDGAERWFDIQTRRAGAESLWIATDAEAVVASERLAKSFVQTLSKTFAELAVGIAIFDRRRRLVMFNPALLDLTGLQAEALAVRPSIRAFLDGMRDRGRLPEPKDYRTWREQVAELEAAAERGTYSETWALTSGHTIRVTGRPHPDGAIAFLFEDISAEISLTRHYRAEIETSRAVLDALPEAIAVFSPGGTLKITNATYADSWGSSAEDLGDARLRTEVEAWREHCAPSPVWEGLRRGQLPRGEDGSPLMLRRTDGRLVSLDLQTVSGGDVLVRFTEMPTPEVRQEARPVEDRAAIG